jgi:hypothetical protein
MPVAVAKALDSGVIRKRKSPDASRGLQVCVRQTDHPMYFTISLGCLDRYVSRNVRESSPDSLCSPRTGASTASLHLLTMLAPGLAGRLVRNRRQLI